MLLTQPYKDYDKAKVSSFTFHLNGKVVFNYQVYKSIENSLFDKAIIVGDESIVNEIKTKKFDNLSPYDCICRSLLEYIKKEGIESGNIEVA
jgi:hypothetical protein